MGALSHSLLRQVLLLLLLFQALHAADFQDELRRGAPARAERVELPRGVKASTQERTWQLPPGDAGLREAIRQAHAQVLQRRATAALGAPALPSVLLALLNPLGAELGAREQAAFDAEVGRWAQRQGLARSGEVEPELSQSLLLQAKSLRWLRDLAETLARLRAQDRARARAENLLASAADNARDASL
jgi:hypothetical protein